MSDAPTGHDLTIVVNTCDSYQDVLELFFHSFHEHWPNCRYPVVVNTERSRPTHDARVHNYFTDGGPDDWGARLRSTLNSINSEYVLMLYDDFLLEKAVSEERITLALKKIQSTAQAGVVYLIKTGLPTIPSPQEVEFLEVQPRAEYRLNSAPGIWRKRTLLRYTEPGDTPWAWEVFGSYRTWDDGGIFYSLNPNTTDIYSFNYSKGGAIYRGKWVRSVVENLAHRYPINIDWQKRGFSSDTTSEKRSLAWKIQFLRTGFRMVGFKAFISIKRYILSKLFHAY